MKIFLKILTICISLTFLYVPNADSLLLYTGDNNTIRALNISDGTVINSFPSNGAEMLAFESLPEPIPEPTTMLLLSSGLIGLAFLRKRGNRGNA